MRLAVLAAVLVACGGDDLRDAEPDDEGDADGGAGEAPLEECGSPIVSRGFAEPAGAGGDAIGAEPTPRHVHLGLRGDPSTSIVIVWRTDEATTATGVRYGRADGALDRELGGHTFRYQTGDAMVRIHEVALCGLEPDTEYRYQVGAPGAFSPVYSFRTAPDLEADPDAEVRVAYLGDSRGGWDAFARVMDQVAARAPDLLVITGDLVDAGGDQAEWDAFFSIAPALMATVPVISAHGNHEANAVNYYAQLAMPGDEESFSFDFGALHQVVVNTDPVDRSDTWGPIADFLDADLAAADDAPWTSVAMHRSLWSPSTAHGDNETLQASWGPIFDAHEVALVVSGHDHVFSRSHPIRGGEVAEQGTTYLVTGGSGAPLYALVDPLPDWVAAAESSYHATLVSVRRDLLVSETFRDDGSPVDGFTLVPPDDRP